MGLTYEWNGQNDDWHRKIIIKILIFLNEKSKPNGDLIRICLINKVNLALVRYRFFKTYFQSLIEPKIIIKIIKIFPRVISHPPLFLFPFPFLFLPCQVIKIIICTVEKESFNFTYILMSYQHSWYILYWFYIFCYVHSHLMSNIVTKMFRNWCLHHQIKLSSFI